MKPTTAFILLAIYAGNRYNLPLHPLWFFFFLLNVTSPLNFNVDPHVHGCDNLIVHITITKYGHARSSKLLGWTREHRLCHLHLGSIDGSGGGGTTNVTTAATLAGKVRIQTLIGIVMYLRISLDTRRGVRHSLSTLNGFAVDPFSFALCELGFADVFAVCLTVGFIQLSKALLLRRPGRDDRLGLGLDKGGAVLELRSI